MVFFNVFVTRYLKELPHGPPEWFVFVSFFTSVGIFLFTWFMSNFSFIMLWFFFILLLLFFFFYSLPIFSFFSFIPSLDGMVCTLCPQFVVLVLLLLFTFLSVPCSVYFFFTCQFPLLPPHIRYDGVSSSSYPPPISSPSIRPSAFPLRLQFHPSPRLLLYCRFIRATNNTWRFGNGVAWKLLDIILSYLLNFVPLPSQTPNLFPGAN